MHGNKLKLTDYKKKKKSWTLLFSYNAIKWEKKCLKIVLHCLFLSHKDPEDKSVSLIWLNKGKRKQSKDTWIAKVIYYDCTNINNK